MPAVAKNSDVEGSEVILSDLHDDLKEKILEWLPLTDAIRTSELSCKWRSSWTSMGCLLFDESFTQSMGYLTDARFARIIERILLLHQGMIQRFLVDIPDYISSPLCLNGWLISLSQKQVQKLEIRCSKNSEYPFFQIPSYLFDCGELTHLHLETCSLNSPSRFQGFHNLLSLHLNFIGISSKELGAIISRCPRLEILSFIDVLSPFFEPLDINAPNLRVLKVMDVVSGMINLKNTSSLTVVVYEFLMNFDALHRKRHSSVELLCSLSTVEELDYDLFLLEPLNGDFPDILEKELASLKTLTLGQVNISKLDDVLFTFCLLRSSPNLKTLHISMHHIKHIVWHDEASVEWLKAEEKKGFSST